MSCFLVNEQLKRWLVSFRHSQVWRSRTAENLPTDLRSCWTFKKRSQSLNFHQTRFMDKISFAFGVDVVKMETAVCVSLSFILWWIWLTKPICKMSGCYKLRNSIYYQRSSYLSGSDDSIPAPSTCHQMCLLGHWRSILLSISLKNFDVNEGLLEMTSRALAKSFSRQLCCMNSSLCHCSYQTKQSKCT